MRQVYVTAISLQKPENLNKYEYQPEGFRLRTNKKTSFPIIPIMASTIESTERVKVIALCSKGELAKLNLEAFTKEAEALGINRDQIAEVPIGNYSNQKEMVRLMLTIMNEIPDESLVYADITYQTKPVAATIMNVMSMVEEYKNERAQVEGIYYGEVHRDLTQAPVNEKGEPIEASIYDLTAMKRLTDIAKQLQILGVSDIGSAIDKLM